MNKVKQYLRRKKSAKFYLEEQQKVLKTNINENIETIKRLDKIVQANNELQNEIKKRINKRHKYFTLSKKLLFIISTILFIVITNNYLSLVSFDIPTIINTIIVNTLKALTFTGITLTTFKVSPSIINFFKPLINEKDENDKNNLIDINTKQDKISEKMLQSKNKLRVNKAELNEILTRLEEINKEINKAEYIIAGTEFIKHNTGIIREAEKFDTDVKQRIIR